MPLKLAGQRKRHVRRSVHSGQRARGQDASDDRRRRGAQATTVRYPVQAAQRDTGRLAPDQPSTSQVIECRPHGSHDQVLFPRVGHLGRTLAGHVECQAAGDNARLDLVIERER